MNQAVAGGQDAEGDGERKIERETERENEREIKKKRARDRERERDGEQCQSRLKMHGFALAGVTMSVLIHCLSPLGAHGTRWRRERPRGVKPKREGVPAVHSWEQ